MAAESNYNPDYHDDWAWSLILKEGTMQDVADAFHVSKRTIERWMTKYESFGKSIAEARAIVIGGVERSIYKRAKGYTYKESKQIMEMDPKTGSPKPIKIENTEKHVPPDVGACCFILKNLDPDNWSDRREINHSGGVNVKNRFDKMSTDELEEQIKNYESKIRKKP